jgi:hypothetical protein
MTNGDGRAWQVLRDLPSWQVTQIPRRPQGQPGNSPGQELRAVGYGTRPASATGQAAGARAGDPDWEQCLAGALTAFQDCGWPLDLLRPAGRDDEH